MVGVDSNVLIRFVTRDDEAQFAEASRLVKQAADHSLYVCLIVLVELNWVLQRIYKRQRTDVLRTIDSLLDSRQFAIEERSLVIRAMALARATRADFADALIALGNEASGYERTVTFDVDALDIAQMVPVAEALA